MMKKLLIVPLLIIGIQTLSAQINVEGDVLQKDGNAIEYFSVTILNAQDSTVYKGGTFVDGSFKFHNVEQGKYIVNIRSLGYVPLFKDLSVKAGEVNHFRFDLSKELYKIDELEVRAKIPPVINKEDRYIVQIENTSASDAGNGVDVLKKTPYITIDSRTKSISVAGKGASLILLNGRKVTSNSEIEMLSSQNIKQIEVIENPSAKYEAEGHAVINIITKRERDRGLNMNLRAVYEKARHHSSQAYGDLTYVCNKWTLFTQYSHADYKIEGFNSNNERYEKDDYVFKSYSYDLKNISNNQSDKYTVGANFYPNKSHLIVLKYDGYLSDMDEYQQSHLDMNKNGIVFPTQEIIDTKIEDPKRQNILFGYNYKKNGLNITLNADYTIYDIASENNIAETYLTDGALPQLKRNEWSTSYDLYTAKLDVSVPVKSLHATLELGSKYSEIQSNNNSHFEQKQDGDWQKVNDFSSKVDYSERIIGVYGVFKGKFNDKMRYSLGIRNEQVDNKNRWSNSDKELNTDTRQNKWYPSASFSYKKSKTWSMRLSYSKRIRRPSYSSLNNSVWYMTSFSTRQGNPNLKSTIYNSLSFSTKYKRISMTMNASYLEDPIELLYINDPVQLERHVAQQVNTESHWAYSVNANTTYSYGIWSVRPFVSLVFSERAILEDGVRYSNNSVGGYFKLTNQFDLTQITMFDFDFLYHRPNRAFKEINDQQTYSFSLRQMLCNKKLTLQASYDYTPTKWNQLMNYSYKNTDFVWDGDDRSRLTLSLSYRFNTTKKKFKSKSSNEDELRRM
ncbi:TonB-dependent receptor [Prolixibacteraceae bacterium]|nr:TonB-dependent receptor [Prolixibacteraceae bacterium]